MAAQIDFERKIHIFPPSLRNTKDIAREIINRLDQEDAFMICNLGDIIQKHLEWKESLPRVKPFYAMKCNDNHRVLQTLASLGTGFDCASQAEIAKLLELGVKPSRIVYSNPIKIPSHFKMAKSNGVDLTIFDSEFELLKTKELHPEARLLVCLKCDNEDIGESFGIKFGVPVEEAIRLLELAKELGLNAVGVSFHVGFAPKKPSAFKQALESSRKIFDAAKGLGFNFNLLNIGGGFPGHDSTQFKEITDAVNVSLDCLFPKDCGVEIIGEPGRYFVTSAFTLLTQVHTIRKMETDSSTSFRYYVNDSVWGSMGNVFFDPKIWDPQPLNETQDGPETFSECSIWGQTLFVRDKVYANALLPKLNSGDWLVFKNKGAYTLVTATTFNGFPIPKVYFVADQNTRNFLKDVIGEENFVNEQFTPL